MIRNIHANVCENERRSEWLENARRWWFRQNIIVLEILMLKITVNQNNVYKKQIYQHSSLITDKLAELYWTRMELKSDCQSWFTW